jgi:DNA phosphorothioation-dependent restriction protein DptG
MKKIIFIALFVFLNMHSFSESLDSLKAKRELLYQEYSEINIPGSELSDKDIDKVVEILKDLVIVDTRIIKEYGGSDKEIKEDADKLKELGSENEALSSEKESMTGLFVHYIYCRWRSHYLINCIPGSIICFYVKVFKIEKEPAYV